MSNYKIGYARVSTKDQDLSIQIKELDEAGCDKIYSEKISGKTRNRPEFEKMQEDLREGDTVIICKLDRMGRDTKDLFDIVNEFDSKGVGLIVLNNKALDTTTPVGKLIFTVFAALADYERELILERTEKGRAAAKARGRQGGRKAEYDEKTIKAVDKLCEEMSVSDACKQVGITRQSYYRLKRTKNAE